MQKELNTNDQGNTRERTAPASSALGEVWAALGRGAAPLERVSKDSPEAPEPEVPEGVYIISVAARMLAMHPQTLRKYERLGLIRPSRTVGMLRLYSEEDVAKLRVIRYLVEELRLNLAGVEIVLTMVDRLTTLRQEMGPRPQAAFKPFERVLNEILAMLQGEHNSRPEHD